MARPPCPCGSGEPRRDLIDGNGIFCTFVCDDCESAKQHEFRPEIFAGPYDADDLGDDPLGDWHGRNE